MPLDYDSVDKGTPIDGLSIPALTRVSLARFAGAVDDYNPIHLDDKVAVAAGKASVYASTNMVMAYLGRMVQQWLTGAALKRYDVKVVRLVWPGDVLTCRGVVNDKRIEDGQAIVEANVWADNQRGENVAKGVVVAVVPKKAGDPAPRDVGVVYNPSGKKAGKGAPPPAKKAAAKKK